MFDKCYNYSPFHVRVFLSIVVISKSSLKTKELIFSKICSEGSDFLRITEIALFWLLISFFNTSLSLFLIVLTWFS